MRRLIAFSGVIALAMMLTVGACASVPVSMWFTDSGGNDISEIVVDSGSTFDIYVWMSTTVVSDGFSCAVAYDRSTRDEKVTGIDGKIGLATGDAANDVLMNSDVLTSYPMSFPVMQRAFIGNSTYASYGIEFSGINFFNQVNPLSATKIGTIKLRNLMTGNDGSTYAICVYNAGYGQSATSLLSDSATGNIYYAAGDTLTVHNGKIASVPEPTGLLAMLGGIVGLAGLAFRRRN